MKAFSLFGVRFASNPQLRAQMFTHYKQWKTKKVEAHLKEKEALVVRYVSAFGLEKEEVLKELEHGERFNPSLDFSEVEHFLEERDCRHYYITNSVMRICKRLKAKEPFDLGWLTPLEDGKRQLNFREGFIRYEKKGDRIVVMSAAPHHSGDDTYFQYALFNMNIDQNTVSGQDWQDQQEDEDYIFEYTHQSFDEMSRRLFFQLICFMELAPVEEIFLPAGRKHGFRKSEDWLLNEADFPITIVNTSWNRIIKVGPIDVEGHFRLQACGPRHTYRRLTWISDYFKNGYNIHATKDSKN